MILACNTATIIGPSFESTAANADATGPWPIVLDGSCVAMTLINPYHFGGADTTYTRDLIYRRTAGASCGITVLGSNYSHDSYSAQEIILKVSGSFGSECYSLRVDSAGKIGTVSGTDVITTGAAYQPAVIFAAIDALLTTDLPTGASLVL